LARQYQLPSHFFAQVIKVASFSCFHFLFASWIWFFSRKEGKMGLGLA
jgi:hypothetical protein